MDMKSKKTIACVLFGVALFSAIGGIAGLYFNWYAIAGKVPIISGYGAVYSFKYYDYIKTLLTIVSILAGAWTILFILGLATKKSICHYVNFLFIISFVVLAFLSKLKLVSDPKFNPIIYDYELFTSTFASFLQLAICTLILTVIPLFLEHLNKKERRAFEEAAVTEQDGASVVSQTGIDTVEKISAINGETPSTRREDGDDAKDKDSVF